MVDREDHGLDVVVLLVEVGAVRHAHRPGEVGLVNHAIHTLTDADGDPVVRDRTDLARILSPGLKSLTKSGPGIGLQFLDRREIRLALASTSSTWHSISSPTLRCSSGVDPLSPGCPTQDKTLNTGFQLHEGAVIRDRDHLAADLLPEDRALSRGKKVRGKVVSITDYGAFVELEPGVEGLVHVSEMSWTKRVKHPKNILNVGDEIECQVLEVDAKAKRISLSIKELEPDPWTIFVNDFNPGDKISGKVRSITDYGIFIGIREGVDGMVHKSDLSWTVRVANPADLYQKNDDVEAVILSINHDEKKASLGINRSLTTLVAHPHPPGKSVEAKVMNVFEGGVCVVLETGIEALIASHELAPDLVDGKKVKRSEPIRADVLALDVNDWDPPHDAYALGTRRVPGGRARRVRSLHRRPQLPAHAVDRPWATSWKRSWATSW